MMKKQKDELEQAIDNLHKNITNQVEYIEDNINLNIISTLMEPERDKYKGWLVQPSKRF